MDFNGTSDDLKQMFNSSGIKVFDVMDLPVKIQQIEHTIEDIKEVVVKSITSLKGEIDEIGAVLLEHRAMITAMINLLKSRELFDDKDIMEEAKSVIKAFEKEVADDNAKTTKTKKKKSKGVEEKPKKTTRKASKK